MDIHEYQTKQLLRSYGLASPPGECAFTADEAELAARLLGGGHWAVKAQILAGGVKMTASEADIREAARGMLGSRLVTPQTGDEGEYVRRVYVEVVCRATSEHYLALGLDRTASRITFVGSDAGGMSSRSVAGEQPERFSHVSIEPVDGLNAADARRLAVDIGLGERHAAEAERLMIGLYDTFVAYDASLIEINPLALTRDGPLLALDAMICIDDNALFRHRDIEDLREHEPEGRLDRAHHGFKIIKLYCPRQRHRLRVGRRRRKMESRDRGSPVTSEEHRHSGIRSARASLAIRCELGVGGASLRVRHVDAPVRAEYAG